MVQARVLREPPGSRGGEQGDEWLCESCQQALGVTRYEQSGQTRSLDETKRALPASEPLASLPSGLADLERELQNIELNADPRWRTGLDMPTTDYSERQEKS